MENRNENTPLIIVEVFFAIVAATENQVSDYTDNYDGSASITFEAGEDWQKIYGTFETINFDEPNEDTPAGFVYNQNLSLVNPGDDKTLRKQLFDLDQKELIVRFDYDNGDSKLIGSIENPAFINVNFTSGSFNAQRSVSFTCIDKEPAKFLE